MALKPQDIYVTLKIVAGGSKRAAYSQLASDLVMSPSEVHACVKRAQASQLLHAGQGKPNFAALEEFLFNGLKYVFPAERGELTRGLATSYAAEPLRSIIAQGNEPIPVWPYQAGKQRGMAFVPLYKTAPAASLQDSLFYEYLALADALRDGRVRERRIAENQLRQRFRVANAKFEF